MVVVTVLAPLAPWTTLTSLAAMEKSLGGGLTVSETVVVCVYGPSVPVMVSVAVPVAAEPVVEMVSVELPPASTGLGPNEADAPEGRPVVTASATLPAGATAIDVLMVLVPLKPRSTVMAAGVPAKAKSGRGLMVRPTLV